MTPDMTNQSPDVGTAADAAVPSEATAAPVTTSQVIRKAADILAAKGWCQSAFTGAGGTVCAAMALFMAEGEHAGEYSLKAMDYMRKFTGALSLPAWNDLYTTTYEDVQTLFKNAANIAEKEGD